MHIKALGWMVQKIISACQMSDYVSFHWFITYSARYYNTIL